MLNISKLTVAGFVGSLEFTAAKGNKKAFLRFGIAETIPGNRASDDSRARWHNFNVHGETAEKLHNIVSKSKSLVVTSRLRYYEIEADGQTIKLPSLNVNTTFDVRVNTWKPQEGDEVTKNSSTLHYNELILAGLVGNIKYTEKDGEKNEMLLFGLGEMLPIKEDEEKPSYVWHDIVSFGEEAKKLHDIIVKAKSVFITSSLGDRELEIGDKKFSLPSIVLNHVSNLKVVTWKEEKATA